MTLPAAPTFAEPVIVDKMTGKGYFNPIWLNWFLQLVTSQNTPGSITAGGLAGQIQFNNAGLIGGFTMTGYATMNTSTGVITVTKVQGVAGSGSPTAGDVGEVITSSASGVALTNGTDATITSISLTAGDWDVYGLGQFTGNVLTTVTQLSSSISLVNNTRDATVGNLAAVIYNGIAAFNVGTPTVGVLTVPYKFASTTTVYLVSEANFAVSTCSGSGLLWARRRR